MVLSSKRGDDEHSRELFTVLRDTWQRVAESWEFMDALETKAPSIPAALVGNPAGAASVARRQCGAIARRVTVQVVATIYQAGICDSCL